MWLTCEIPHPKPLDQNEIQRFIDGYNQMSQNSSTPDRAVIFKRGAQAFQAMADAVKLGAPSGIPNEFGFCILASAAFTHGYEPDGYLKKEDVQKLVEEFATGRKQDIFLVIELARELSRRNRKIKPQILDLKDITSQEEFISLLTAKNSPCSWLVLKTTSPKTNHLIATLNLHPHSQNPLLGFDLERSAPLAPLPIAEIYSRLSTTSFSLPDEGEDLYITHYDGACGLRFVSTQETFNR